MSLGKLNNRQPSHSRDGEGRGVAFQTNRRGWQQGTKRGLRGRHVGKWRPGKRGGLPWRVTKKTQPAAQARQRARPHGPWQKSEAFVVAWIPRRTSGPENARGSEGTPLVSRGRRAGRDPVTARGRATSARKGPATTNHPVPQSQRLAAKELGKPDAGKPPVRFDEGREADGHWPEGLSTRRSPPTLHSFSDPSALPHTRPKPFTPFTDPPSATGRAV